MQANLRAGSISHGEVATNGTLLRKKESKQPAPAEDPLSYLPRVAVREYQNGEVLYTLDSVNTHLYLVIDGLVSVTRRSGSTDVVMNLCQTEEMFGESSLVQRTEGEQAQAIGPVKVMSWHADAIVDLALRQAGLGVALAQMIACRCISLEGRIVGLSADSTVKRLANALLYLAERLGHPESADPRVSRMPPFSHKLLAQFIGSTRAAVTRGLIQLRRSELIQYSRQWIMVNSAGLEEWLHNYRAVPSTCLPTAEK